MAVDIRKYTRIIVRKNGMYLQCRSQVTNALVWCDSPNDAWWTRDREAARRVAMKTGGTRMLFNPVVGKVAVM